MNSNASFRVDLTGEAFLSSVVRGVLGASKAHIRLFDGLVPPIIRFEMEFPVPRGRIDALVIHDDGSLTACEIKDGSRGLQNVLSGIGQVISYGVQLGMSRSGFPQLRKALLFSRTSSIEDDAHIAVACVNAGVIPVPLGSETEIKKAVNQGVC